MAKSTWQDIAAGKKQQRTRKIPKQWTIPIDQLPADKVQDVQDWPHTSGFFTPKELEITECTASEVVQKIATGKWTSLEVMQAICKRASVAQQLINCVTEICFDEAILRAKELDEYFAKVGKTVGPLHGLPISFKDQFNIKGLDTSVGYVSWVNKPATRTPRLCLCSAQLELYHTSKQIYLPP